MSILFVLLMFLLVMSISYFRSRGEMPAQQPERVGGSACSAPATGIRLLDSRRILLSSGTHLGAERRRRECARGRRQLCGESDWEDRSH